MEVSGAAGIEADGKEKEVDDEKVEKEDGVVGRVVEEDAGAVVEEGGRRVGRGRRSRGGGLCSAQRGRGCGCGCDRCRCVVAGTLVSVAAVVVPVVVGALNDAVDIVGQNVREVTDLTKRSRRSETGGKHSSALVSRRQP